MFKKIVAVEPIAFIDDELEKVLKKMCKNFVKFDTSCNDDKERIERISDADCIMVSYKTEINKEVIDASKNLKFVCMCCSFYGSKFSKVDTDYLTKRGIKFSALSGHGDNGVVDFTIAESVNLLQGINCKCLKEGVYDLTGINYGILGFGGIGQKLALALNSMGTKVFYYSRTRKQSFENEMLKYLPLDELLKRVDILSINLNRDVCLIGGDKLKIFGNGKAIINTSIGKCYELKSLQNWLKNKNNFYVFDKASINSELEQIKNLENVIYVDHIVGDTMQCIDRARAQIIKNLKDYKNYDKDSNIK